MPTSIATDFINFSRGSLATVTDSDGKIKWAGHNFAVDSENFKSSNWIAASTTVTTNVATAPNGTMTADRANVSAGGTLYQLGPITLGAKYKIAFWVKSFGGTNQTFRLYGDGTQSSGDLTATSSWQLFEYEFTATTGGATRTYGLNVGTGNNAFDVLVWGAHLYRSDLGGMVLNPARGDAYYPTTPKNLLGYTEDFTNSYWTKSNATIVANATTAPNGLMTADLLYPTTSGSARSVYNAVNGGKKLSIIAKAAGFSYLWIVDRTGGLGAAWFNLSTGEMGTVISGYVPNMQPLGNGWYRCAIETTTGVFSYAQFGVSDVDNSLISTANGTNGVYMWGAQMSDSASLDPYVPVYGAAQTSAAYYAPRIDYDPVTLAAKGLLVEEAKTNLVTQSDFANGLSDAPTRSGLLTATTFFNQLKNTGIAFGHDGTTISYAYKSFIPSASTAYVLSIFVRMADGNAPVFSGAFDSSGHDFALVLGSQGYSLANAIIQNIGNNIYRVSAAVTSTSSPGSNTGIIKYAANSARTFTITGLQVELGTFATSYIPTDASAATRSKDVATVNTQAFPYSSTEGTLVAAFDCIGFGINGNAPASLTDDPLSASWVLLAAGAGGASSFRRSNSVSASTITVSTAVSTNIVQKAATGFSVNGTDAISFNGAAVVTQAGVAAPYTNSILRVGGWGDNPGPLNGHIRSITYIPKRLSNEELRKRTT